MAWGNKTKPKPPPSVIAKVVPLIVVLIVISVAAWVGYQVYLSVSKMSESASEKMNKKNVVFTKDGVKVGVKEIKNENYVDKTQDWVVKAWNLGNQDSDLKKKKKK